MLKQVLNYPTKCFRGFTLAYVNMSSVSDKDINFEQLKKFIDEQSVYLIDVREKKELQETGVLPCSINIPLAEVDAALQLSEDDFNVKYGARKPSVDDTIVFSCRSGRRSAVAQDTAQKLGFKKVLNYAGGWSDWEENTRSSEITNSA